MFTFDFNTRAQWWYDTPNHLASMLGMALLLLAGGRAWFLQHSPKSNGLRLIFTLIFWAMVGGLTLTLVRTYSRGGWAGFVTGLSIFLFSLRKWRRVPLVMFLVFLALLVSVPDSKERANPEVFGKDKSVLHRLLVWKGALEMTADHWLMGVGHGHFGQEFTPWYQPRGMKTEYNSAINNYLTLSAEHGIFALWVYLCLVLGVLWMAWRKAVISQNVLILAMFGSEGVYLVDGFFSYSLTLWEIAWPFWTLFAVCFCFLLSHKKEPMKKSILLHQFVSPALVSTLICALLLLSGFHLRAELSTRSDSFIFNETGQNKQGVIVRPTKVPAQGVMIWSHGKGGSIREDGRDTLRYLAEKGLIVISINYRDNLKEGLEDLRALLKWTLQQKEFESLPIFLGGHSLGGHLSILTACYDPHPRLKGLASIGAASEWPFPEFSPADHLYDLKCPFLIVHGDNDQVNDVSNAYDLEKLCQRQRKPHEIFIVKGGSHHLDDGDQWFTALDRIAEFFRKYFLLILKDGKIIH